jgi:hypothetical protein
MSTYWSMYVVPDTWKLVDCMATGYMMRTLFMMSRDERKEAMDHKKENDTRLYDELIKQPCLYEYTSDDGGDPDHARIMQLIPITGVLYEFPDEAYTLIKGLREFTAAHQGKRYICMN